LETQAILEALEALLEEERTAIRKLQGERVHGIAREKLALMKALDAARGRGFGEHAPRVKTVVRRLRHNAALLVQARSILGEVVRLKRATLASAQPVASLAAAASRSVRPNRLSVVG
jgi:flagellar biosynthesis/type III secretory pathway chaperone